MKGWFEEKAAAIEALASIKGADADVIIVHCAEQVAGCMRETS